jgi:hypothetical protein
MFRADWSEKPNSAVWREWVLGKWTTRFDGVTGVDGAIATRGHLGHYRVSVTREGIVNRQDLTLTHAGAELTVTFP